MDHCRVNGESSPTRPPTTRPLRIDSGDWSGSNQVTAAQRGSLPQAADRPLGLRKDLGSSSVHGHSVGALGRTLHKPLVNPASCCARLAYIRSRPNALRT
jgi:hypothetical protein